MQSGKHSDDIELQKQVFKSFPTDAGDNVLASPLPVALQNQMQIIIIYSIFTTFMEASSGGIFNFLGVLCLGEARRAQVMG